MPKLFEWNKKVYIKLPELIKRWLFILAKMYILSYFWDSNCAIRIKIKQFRRLMKFLGNKTTHMHEHNLLDIIKIGCQGNFKKLNAYECGVKRFESQGPL